MLRTLSKSKSLPQLLDKLKNNDLPIYHVINDYTGNDFTEPLLYNHPTDSIMKIGTVNKLDVNLCILKPNTFYYNKVPSYIRVLEGAAYVELEVENRINPGFMISQDMSLKLCQPHTLSNNNMGKRNILLTISKTVNSNELPLL